jgi:HAE1 family hydrophobic/amphiphilic exporter-1
MFLSDVSIKRPVFATMMMVALVVLGVVSYKRLAIDEYPDVTYPVVVAQTSYPGASPEVMDARDLEADRGGAQHRAGDQGDHLDLARGRLDRPRAAQPGRGRRRGAAGRAGQGGAHPPPAAAHIEDPIIQHFDPNERPIMSIALQSEERPIREITDLADEVIRRASRRSRAWAA